MRVDLGNKKIRRAINYIHDQITLTMKVRRRDGDRDRTWFGLSCRDVSDYPLICFSPAETKKEIKENKSIYRRCCKGTSREHITWYLYYHGCDEVAILVWTILHDRRLKPKIFYDGFHTYCTVRSKGITKIYDPLFYYCLPQYRYPKPQRRFKNPKDYIIWSTIGKKRSYDEWQEWEKKLVRQVSRLE